MHVKKITGTCLGLIPVVVSLTISPVFDI